MCSGKLRSKVCFKGGFVYKERKERQLGRMELTAAEGWENCSLSWFVAETGLERWE